MSYPKTHKIFLSYLRVSTKEGLFSEITTTDTDLKLGKYNEDIYRECEWCNQIFKIKIAFKENPFICNGCHKLLKSEDVRDITSSKIILYYAENQIYRICTNLDRYQAETIFKKDKEGSLSKETIYKFLNS